MWFTPVKLCCEGDSRYYSGWTRDVSAGGAMLGVAHASALTAGQKVRLGLVWGQHQVLLAYDDLFPGTIIRSINVEGHHDIAVQFHERQVVRGQLDRPPHGGPRNSDP